MALRLNMTIANAAGITVGMPVRIFAKPGQILIEMNTEPTLDSMLSAFDPKRHSGEMMAFGHVGTEALASSRNSGRSLVARKDEGVDVSIKK